MKYDIVHVTTVHPRTDIRVFHKMVNFLAKEGHNVSLIVADGKGSERTKSGINIIDVGVFKPRVIRMLITPWLIVRNVISLDVKCVHFHDPDFLPAALFLKLLRYKVIYDSHEDVPRQILGKEWIPTRFKKIISKVFEIFENFSVKRMDGVVVATETIGKRFYNSAKYVSVVKNYPILEEFSCSNKKNNQEKTLCYVGAISRGRGIVPLVKSLEHLPDYKLILAGKFESNKLEEDVRNLPGWGQVDYRGVVDRTEISRILEQSSIGVVTLLPLPNYVDSLPIKMFEYMAAGLPVLASNFPSWKNIIEIEGCGMCVDPANPKEIARTISAMKELNKMGSLSREVAVEKYNWNKQFEILNELYKKIGVVY